MKEGRGKGARGGREGERGRAGGRKGGRGGKVLVAGNLKKLAAPPPSMRLWCDPQLGDEGRVSDINMRRIF